MSANMFRSRFCPDFLLGARVMLGWDHNKVAALSGLSAHTVRAYESLHGDLSGPKLKAVNTLLTIALESASITLRRDGRLVKREIRPDGSAGTNGRWFLDGFEREHLVTCRLSLLFPHLPVPCIEALVQACRRQFGFNAYSVEVALLPDEMLTWRAVLSDWQDMGSIIRDDDAARANARGDFSRVPAAVSLMGADGTIVNKCRWAFIETEWSAHGALGWSGVPDGFVPVLWRRDISTKDTAQQMVDNTEGQSCVAQ